ncbi:putative nitrogenase cofactor biosynthesis protein NifB [Spirochaetia bacterium]|nr:putative nitrogenase cofactor biosynthesis protein NifB [Spirochaetia bacterium]
MQCLHAPSISEQFSHVANLHPCFSGDANMNRARIHLPVSPLCNIQCRFCKRSFNKNERRPGVTAELLKPEAAVEVVSRALEMYPEITVVGIAGPGDTLATTHALETFALIHEKFPSLINCLSTNGLLLERNAEAVQKAGVQTLTVTVNAVDPVILDKICSRVFLDGVNYQGVEGAALLIEAQKRGIKKAAGLGMLIKINIVLIPSVNGSHIAEIARTVKEAGAGIINIIPLIPQHEFEGFPEPDCFVLDEERRAAEQFLPVFRHCQHCRADAIGIPGKGDRTIADLLPPGYSGIEQTFSHG